MYNFYLDKGVGMYHGLFNVSSITQTFSLFIIIITIIILTDSSFYNKSVFSVVKNRSKGNIMTYITKIQKEIYKNLNLNLMHNIENEKKISLPDTKSQNYQIMEYSTMIIFVLSGVMFLMISNDLISLFISIELQSYALYILSTIYKNSERASWGGLTYFLLGGLSSCFILLGMGIIYINTGCTSLDGFYIINSILELDFNDIKSVMFTNIFIQENYTNIPINILDFYYINIALTLFIVGFLFKVSAAPFHFWSPDVYDAIPTNVTTYVAIIAKLSIFVFLIEIVYYISGEFSTVYDSNVTYSWKNSLLISSILSLLIGSILGLSQYRIKRLYAYSTISHVGFILLALGIDKIESIQAYIFYILSYSLSNLNAFIILIAIGYHMYLYVDKSYLHNTKDKYVIKHLNNLINIKHNIGENNKNSLNYEKIGKDIIINNNSQIFYKNEKEIENTLDNIRKTYILSYQNSFLSLKLNDISYSPIQLTNQLKGYFYINPYLSLSLAITLFSFIGIPPLLGFFAKQMVLSAALDNGYIFITLIGIITSVISAGYYLNLIKIMFFFKPDVIYNPILYKINYLMVNKFSNIKSNNIQLSNTICLIISVLTLLISVFIFTPNESFTIARTLALIIYN